MVKFRAQMFEETEIWRINYSGTMKGGDARLLILRKIPPNIDLL